jgi:hypothetical protein
MDRQMIIIDRVDAVHLIQMMSRAEGYCRNAVSTSQLQPEDDPTCSYPGASGYAGATLREAIQVLETAL